MLIAFAPAGASAAERATPVEERLPRVEPLPRDPELPKVERLPEVEIGQEAIHGDFLQLDAPTSAKVTFEQKLRVTRRGILPPIFALPLGETSRIVVVREASAEESCAARLSSPELAIELSLPVGEAQTKLVTPRRAGIFRLACPSGEVAAAIRVVKRED